MSKEHYCIGNNLAILIGAYELAKSGDKVKLFTDGNFLGGYFSGITLDEKNFDFGMFLFEQLIDQYNQPQNTARSTINSWLGNSSEISRWLNKHVELKRALTPQTYIFGNFFPDYIMTNRLDIFLSDDIQPPVKLDSNSPIHASNKEFGEKFDEMTYKEASINNHGNEFHMKYIEPFINKIIGYGSDNFLARYHRFSWAPLYYPETLRDAIINKNITMKEYPFWTTKNGFIGDLVKNIIKKIQKMKNLEIIDKKLTKIFISKNKLTVDDDSFNLKDRVHLGLSMNRANKLLGLRHKLEGIGVDFTIGIALVHKDALSEHKGCVFIVDDKYASYRVTDQDAIAGLNPQWHRIVIESNQKSLQKLYINISLEDAISKDLKSYFSLKDDKLIKILKVLNIKNGLYLPTKDFIKNKKAHSNKILEITHSNCTLSGDLLDYGTSSINNQIMQGLQIGGSI